MRTVAVILLIIAGVLVAVFAFRSSTPSLPTGENARAAIEFAFPDYEGNVVSNADVSDKELIVLNFWASWCPFCVGEMPDFASLQEEFADEIAVVAVNRAEDLKTAKEFSDRVGVSDKLTLLLDKDDRLYRAYGAFAMPTTYFIKDNKVLDQKFGPMELDEMRERVQKLLSAAPQ